MLLSLRWLKEFVPVTVPVSELAHKLTMSGFEIESIVEIGPQWDHIIVAEVLESTRHPDADKLTVNTVYTGEMNLQVVCGAPNVAPGQKVALALPGAAFPSGLIIKRSKIRGQRSEGMLCSASELCIGEADGGILVLDSSHIPGTLLADALDLRDTVLDVSITPNRADCLSVIGMAREVAALFDVPLNIPMSETVAAGPSVAETITIDIQDSEACPRYCAGYAYNITIAPSPLWMRRRLENCGLRSINNIVDITNYVLLEWGQPLHAFDYSLLQGKQIVVRAAGASEQFTTLDDVSHTLPSGSLMICDAEQPRALAGIMGGLNSSITSETKTVLLESAWFKPAKIAETSRSLGIKTEASLRFEKGVDINGVVPALQRAAALIIELEAGSIASDILDCYPVTVPEPAPIPVHVPALNTILGLCLDAQTVTGLLSRLQMRVTSDTADCLSVTPPSHRYDITSQIDIIEEVARLNGYDTIPVTYPSVHLSDIDVPGNHCTAVQTRALLTAAGFCEVINYSFQDPALIDALRFTSGDARRDPVRLLNPLSSSQSAMRTTLLGSLLQNLQSNLNANRCPWYGVFEISNVFIKDASDRITEKSLLAGLACGTHHTDTWSLSTRPVDIFDIKGCIEALMHGLNIRATRCEPGSNEPFLAPRSGMSIFIGDDYCGMFGTLLPDIAEAFDALSPVNVFELDFNLICAYYTDEITYIPFSRFPAVQRDIALVIDQSITADDISAAIAGFGHKLLKQWQMFDYYQGTSIEPGKKSLAYRLTFQSDERTLTDSEVTTIHDKLLETLRIKLGAGLR
jgi:phenylalanyl-tRNA synthetase beta chain